jgi:hypothetical protein
MSKGLIFTIVISLFSCNKLRDYLREPDTQIIAETLRSTRLTGYSAAIAMGVINGYSYPNTNLARSNNGYPCTAIININLADSLNSPAEKVTIAGLWADASTAVLSIIYSNYDYRSNLLEFVGIETIPVIVDGSDIHVVLASQEISLNPDQDALLAIDLDNFQFESEILRLDLPRPNDVYIAVTQDAYFIDVNTNGTISRVSDDSYTISGGGQFIEVENNSVEIAQQAVIDVHISQSCQLNPLSGMALLRITGVEEDGFPEMGTVLLEFDNKCEGKASVFVATGIYAASNGKKLPFIL